MKKEYCSSRFIFRIFLALIPLLYLNIPLRGQSYLSALINQQLSELKRENRFEEARFLLELQIDTLKLKADKKPFIEAKIQQADIYRMEGHYRQSAELIDSLLFIYSADLPANEPLLARLLTIRGTLLLTQGELKKGRSAIEQAMSIYTKTFGNEDTLLAPCYNKLGNYFYFIKKYDSAMICYSRALELADKKHNNLEDRASYIQNIGIIHLELADYSKAETFFLESLRLKESIFTPNSFSLGRIYLNLGRFYQGISAFDKALFYIEKAEKIFYSDVTPSPIELGSIYWNKGTIYQLLGDFEPALYYLFNAKQIIDSICIENYQIMSSLNADIGNVYKFMEEYEKAIFYYNLSLAGADTLLKIKIYRNIASLYLWEGNLIKSQDYFNKLLSVSKETIKIKNTENAMTFFHYGNYLVKKGDSNAIQYLNASFYILNEIKGFYDKDVATSLYCIGDYYSSKNILSEALTYYQKSLLSFSRSYLDTNILKNPPNNSLYPDNHIINALSRKAYFLNKFYQENGDLKYLIASGQTYLLCLDLIEKLRMAYKAENSQMMLSGDIADIYKQAIGICYATYGITNDKEWLNKAFNISERGKSIVLLNELKDANAKKSGSIPEYLRKTEKEIRSNLNLYRNNIWEEENLPDPDEKKLDYFRLNQLKYEKQYDSLTQQLEKNYPEYYKLKYDPSVISVEDLQHILEKDELVIEYTLTEDFVYIFLISGKQFEVKRISIDSTLVKDIFALRENLDFDHVPDYTFNDFVEYQRIAYRLYSKLIQPVDSFLERKKVIIIPDEELNFLSFESLIQRIIPSDTINFRNLPYLIKQIPISYAASATILSLIKDNRRPALNNGVLALAPSFNVLTRNFLGKKITFTDTYKSAYDLPGATWEAETILQLMKGKKLIGEQATEEEFKKLASDYDILHFATHTRINNENPLSSMLSFYPYDGSGEDGVLHTYEIYNLDLHGELAVLSACSTGDGKLLSGEGVISLARAFTYAGMPSVMMTLWDVEDISTGNIIPSFYQLIGEGYEKDVALRLAKLHYLDKTESEIETHPAFWSGFVLYGNSRGFRQRIDDIYLISLFVLGGLIIFLSFVMIRRYINFRKNSRHIDLPIKFHSEDRL